MRRLSILLALLASSVVLPRDALGAAPRIHPNASIPGTGQFERLTGGMMTVGLIGAALGFVVSDAARSIAGDGIRALTSWVADGAGWLCRKCFDAMSATSDPRPGQGWFSDSYRRMTLIAAVLSAPCLILGIAQAILHQDARLL